MKEPDEHALLARCAAGDERAWAEFLKRYGRFLDFVIRRALLSARGGRVPCADDVDEVRGEVVAWLCQSEGRVLKTYRGESKLTSWLGVIVGRRARRIAGKGEGLRQKTVSLDALSAEATSHLAFDSGGSGARQEALQALGSALSALKERDRILLRGAFYEKKSYTELAQELGVRPDSVGQLLFRAKKRLREKLGGDAFLETLSGWLLACLSLVLGGGP